MRRSIGAESRRLRRAWSAAIRTARGWGGWRREPLPVRPLVVVAAALAAGVWAGIGWAVPPEPAWGAAVAALAGWAVSRGRPAAAAFLVAAVVCGGAAWGAVRSSRFAADDLAWSLDDTPAPVVVEGTVVGPVRATRTPSPGRTGPARPGAEFVVAIHRARDGADWRTRSGRALVQLDGPCPALDPGQHVRLWGTASRPAPPGNPGEFDRRARAREERCLTVIRVATPAGLEASGGSGRRSFARAVARLRAAGLASLAAHVPPARYPLAAALLLGAREGLSPELTAGFLVTGTIHVLSISGLHVALLAVWLFAWARGLRMRRGPAVVVVAAVTGVYMLVVGAETPVLRATLVVWLACLGAALGRRAGGFTGLAAAAVVVLAWHPASILRVGTQLSFLSTGVLVACASALAAARRVDDPIARLVDASRPAALRRLRRAGRVVVETLLVGGAVWLATAPLVARDFHLVSPVGLAINPLVGPVVGLAMACGFVCMAAASLLPPLAAAAGAGCGASLGIVEWMVDRAAELPGAFAWVAGPPGWWVVGWYAGMVAIPLVLAAPRLRHPSAWCAPAAAWVLVGCIASVAPARSSPCLETWAAAMGHGCGIVVRGPAGGCLVYDAGRLGAGHAAARGLAGLLWTEGIRRVDVLVISHADADHFNGVPDLVARFPVGRVVVSAEFLAARSPAVTALLRTLESAGVPVETVRAGNEIAVDSLCRVRVLHPPAPTAAGGGLRPDNESSVVAVVESAGRRLLLTGDLEGESLRRFVADGPGPCDVLVAPHHGSVASLPTGLVRTTSPSFVIVSGPGGPRWTETARAWAAEAPAGATIVRTEAALRMRLRASGVAVEMFRDGAWRTLGADAAGPRAPRDLGGLPAFAGGVPAAP